MAITINGNTNTIAGLAVGGLPDGIVDADTLASEAVTVAKASGSVKGMQEVDQWRISADQAINAGGVNITSGWERNDVNFEKIGTGMTESAGLFSFPSTGKWEIDFRAVIQDTDKNKYAGLIIYFTTDGSSYVQAASAYDAIFDNGGDDIYANSSATVILDITSTTNRKVRLWVGGESDVMLQVTLTECLQV